MRRDVGNAPFRYSIRTRNNQHNTLGCWLAAEIPVDPAGSDIPLWLSSDIGSNYNSPEGQSLLPVFRKEAQALGPLACLRHCPGY